MKAPQIIMIVLWSLNMGMALNDKYNNKISTSDFIAKAMAVATYIGILWWGGFFG